MGSFRLILANALRVIHITLWLTIPTTFWLWLVKAEPPVECRPEYGWYKGNVLCVSEDAHLWITFGLFLLGFLVIASWIYGYGFDVLGRTLHGDKRPPPLRMMSAVEGCGLSLMSLKYWLPAIAYLIVITILASTLPLATRNHSYHALLMIGAPVMLVMYWGYLVGLARYAADGDHTLLYRRRENMRLALTNIRSTLAVTLLLVVATIGGAWAMASMEFLAIALEGSDLMLEAAVGSFVFFFVLVTWFIICSYLFARYARKIGLCTSFRR